MDKHLFPIVDLHNDLLSYLTHKKGRTPHEAPSLSSFKQMQQGNVKTQILAIFTTTNVSCVQEGMKQVEAFHHLLKTYPKEYMPLKKDFFSSSGISILPAIENASAFACEDDPLSLALERLEHYLTSLGSLAYISLTWNGENRFGGGCGSSKGLKEDGKQLLRQLHGRRIAIDFSHASDYLAHDLFNYIDTHGLDIPVLASHSNFRSITSVERNLPDEIAKEIISRKGLIGLNLFAPFIHAKKEFILETLLEHISHGLALGGENALALGADFFCIEDFPHIQAIYPNAIFFAPELEDSSCYPHLFSIIKKNLYLEDPLLKKISHENAMAFLKPHLTHLSVPLQR
jgi:microsomal dipeptidase-like Zn-dependent dipeptidase